MIILLLLPLLHSILTLIIASQSSLGLGCQGPVELDDLGNGIKFGLSLDLMNLILLDFIARKSDGFIISILIFRLEHTSFSVLMI